MSDKTLVRQSARELARLIRTRAVSPLDVLDAHLDVIAALNPNLLGGAIDVWQRCRGRVARVRARSARGRRRRAGTVIAASKE